ncbi:acyltransferase [Candidatus Contubernalis alkaliaceticus]|uniref:acyltransferase n=1 Tax=Candidatus Contubernalis alkaliaceticus TaxID=338645 RepID=UPI001F4BD4B9|nr:acyltransferase [Candidatus Contubernalis alkalaceticus]UNC93564.1 acyltransferase [Candidatus Contubernalis alkalaceticus]
MSFIKYLWGIRAVFYKLRFQSIGKMSYIGKPLFLLGTNKCNIGNRVRIYPGLRMEIHGKGGISIEENVSIGQNLHIISKDIELVIGKNTTLSGNVFITNIDHDYRQIGQHVMNQHYLVKETILGKNCFIGYGACIQAGTKLGKQCVVGANAVVRGEFPDYCVIAGVPARIIRQYNKDTGEWQKK